MTIERFTLTPPLNVSKASDVKLEDALMFAKRREVPPGFRQDVTPSGYRDKYTLRTTSAEQNGLEDTVGQIEVANPKTGAHKKADIDEQTPICVIARSNVLDGGEGIRINEVIRYVPSIGAQHSMDEQTSASIPLESVFQSEASEPIPVEMPISDETPIPVEIPHYNNV